MRAKGEGSIYQRADGRFVGTLELKSPDGKRKRRMVYGKSRREVLDKLEEARTERREGRMPIPGAGKITVGRLLDEYLRAISKPNAKLGVLTRAQYETEVEVYVRRFLGHVAITKLTDDVLTDWQDAMLAAGYSPRSVTKARIHVGAIIRLARKRKLLHSNPLELVDTPSAARPKKRAISGDEAGRFLRAIRGSQWETLILADLLSGCRRGELLGWTWENVDLDAGTVRINQQLQRARNSEHDDSRHARVRTLTMGYGQASKREKSRIIDQLCDDTGYTRKYALTLLNRPPRARPTGTKLQLLDPKTESSTRTLPLPSFLVERLRVQRMIFPNSDLVFATSKGKPIEPRIFNREFKQLVEQAGLAPLTPHELRHSTSTILLALGVPAVVVSQLLGHADASVTLRWYTHDVPDAHREAMGRLDEYIRRLDQEHVEDVPTRA